MLLVWRQLITSIPAARADRSSPSSSEGYNQIGLSFHEHQVLANAEGIGLANLPVVRLVRDVFKELYDQGYERWDHSAFILHLEKLNSPARLGEKADTPPE